MTTSPKLDQFTMLWRQQQGGQRHLNTKSGLAVQSTTEKLSRFLLTTVCRGDPDISVVVKDILSLTKLNYNTCICGDGVPITLEFADAVGRY